MRALYLHGNPPLRVKLDGPALRIAERRRAPRLYPFRLLARITVSGQVEWSTAALLACLDQGIPVTFLDQHGAARGWCVGPSVRRLPLVEQLLLFLDRPDWAVHYQAWRHAMERRAVLSLLRRLGTPALELRRHRLIEQLRGQARRLAPATNVEAAEQRLQGLLGAHLSSLFVQAGLGPDTLFLEPSGLNLLSDFQAVLSWDLWYELLHVLARLAGAAGTGVDAEAALYRMLATGYEERALRTEKLFRQLLASLDRRLREVER